MKHFRLLSAGLLAFALTSLAACGSDDNTTAAPGSSQTATASTAPSSSAAASPTVAKLSDDELCGKYKAAKKALFDALIASTNGNDEPPPAAAKKALTDLSEALAKAAAGQSGKVADVMAEFSAEAAKAAAAADPVAATEKDAFGKPGDRLDALCKAA